MWITVITEAPVPLSNGGVGEQHSSTQTVSLKQGKERRECMARLSIWEWAKRGTTNLLYSLHATAASLGYLPGIVDAPRAPQSIGARHVDRLISL